jgi:hypothetical protein
MAEKLYPFSARKHAHDIEFRRNRVNNEINDMEFGRVPWDDETYNRMYGVFDALTELLEVIMGSHAPIVQLTGAQIGLAKETVWWAQETRADTQRRKEARPFP